MNTKQWIAIVLVAMGVSGAGVYRLTQRQHQSAVPVAASSQREALYWYDPMQPEQHFDKPGKSPFMDMQLVPKYADEAHAQEQGGVKIDSTTQQNLGVRLASVERGSLSRGIDVAGTLMFNQRDVAIVQARTGGFVTRAYALAPGDVVARGAPLVEVLVPEWAGAQAEFIALLQNGAPVLANAARQRLLLLGMSPTLIAEVERTRRPRTSITIDAPIAGVIESLDVRTGMTLASGATLAKINGLASVWLEAAVPESQSAALMIGQPVQAELAALGHSPLRGTILAILPETNADTRTVRVRIELPNPKLQLKPGMYARVHLEAERIDNALLIPSQAIIHDGARSIVMVADQGRFRPVEVNTGLEAQGKTVVHGGLEAGQQIVASGQFLIDSEANLSGTLTRFESRDHAAHASGDAP